jgi:hypothetical protein
LLFIHLRWKRFLDRYGRFFPQAQREQDTLVLYWCCSKARLHMLETGSVTPNEISRVAQEVARLSRLPIGDGGAPFLLWLMNDLEQTERFVTHLKPAALRKITSQKQILFALQQLDTEAPHPQPGLGEHA